MCVYNHIATYRSSSSGSSSGVPTGLAAAAATGGAAAVCCFMIDVICIKFNFSIYSKNCKNKVLNMFIYTDCYNQ